MPVREKILSSTLDNSNPRSLASRLRRRRFRIVDDELARLSPPKRVLDVGGTAGFWRSLRRDLGDLELTVLNANPSHASVGDVTVQAGDARSMPEFATGSFDLVFSNSVIEHVGGPTDQRAMADEVRRIGRRWVLQTPCRWFPVEPHFLFPYFNLLPLRAQVFLLQHLRLGWAKQPIADRDAAVAKARSVQLVALPALRAMFPDAEVRRERVLGLTKSYVLVGPVARVGHDDGGGTHR
ncbi:MAG: Methyltransferase type 11 [Acidimicrobiales bacterium]|nr:Methyltransferase type 11 [Acidimicrobiales bacterium]